MRIARLFCFDLGSVDRGAVELRAVAFRGVDFRVAIFCCVVIAAVLSHAPAPAADEAVLSTAIASDSSSAVADPESTRATIESDGLSAAIEAAQRGDFSAALRAAQSEPDPLQRAQAELYVRHHAGDLDGALRAGAIGLQREPSDAWLLERSLYIALTLRRATTARTHLEGLERALADGKVSTETRATMQSAASSARAEISNLENVDRARARDARRSRWVTIVGFSAVLALLAWLGFGPDRSRRVDGVD